jgi:hypothetical protein
VRVTSDSQSAPLVSQVITYIYIYIEREREGGASLNLGGLGVNVTCVSEIVSPVVNTVNSILQ